MKALLAPALLAVAALMLGTILVLTCANSPSVLRPLDNPLTDLNLDLSNPASMFLYQQPTPDSPHPGVHQVDPQSTITPFPSRSAVPSQPTPLDLDNLPPPPPPLLAGVYQTYPYTLIIVGPERGIDDRSIIGIPNNNSPMPIVKPHVEVIPKS